MRRPRLKKQSNTPAEATAGVFYSRFGQGGLNSLCWLPFSFSSVQPLADYIGDYACYNRRDKREDLSHSNHLLPVPVLEVAAHLL